MKKRKNKKPPLPTEEMVGKTLLLIFLVLLAVIFFIFIAAAKGFSSEKQTPAEEKNGQQNSCSVLISAREARQGDIIAVDIFLLSGDIKKLSGTFNGKELKFYQNGSEAKALVGVDLYQPPGEYELKITYEKETYVEKIIVKEGEFPVSEYKNWGRGKPYTKKDAAKIIGEKNKITAMYRSQEKLNAPKMWKNEFAPPISIEGKIGDYVTSPFGQVRILGEGRHGKPKRWHQGVDFRAPAGTPVLAAAEGKIAFIGRNFFMEGNFVVINHGAGVYSSYLHLSEISAKKIGQTVEKGEIIGLSGSTGNSNQPHLHFGMKINGSLVDPLKIFEIVK